MRIGKGNPKYFKKTYPDATLPTTNPTLLELTQNPGR
jgi:hypothetical protein